MKIKSVFLLSSLVFSQNENGFYARAGLSGDG